MKRLKIVYDDDIAFLRLHSLNITEHFRLLLEYEFDSVGMK